MGRRGRIGLEEALGSCEYLRTDSGDSFSEKGHLIGRGMGTVGAVGPFGLSVCHWPGQTLEMPHLCEEEFQVLLHCLMRGEEFNLATRLHDLLALGDPGQEAKNQTPAHLRMSFSGFVPASTHSRSGAAPLVGNPSAPQ